MTKILYYIEIIWRKRLDVYFMIMTKFFRFIFPKYRFSWYHLDWYADKNFNSYLEKFNAKKQLNTDRRWNLYQTLRLIENIEGDTVECGTFTGESSYLICAYNKESSKRRVHYMFDSFEGVSSPGKEDGSYWKKGDLSTSEQILKNNLSPFIDSCVILKGWIPEKFSEVRSKQFAFIHIDVDLYQPTYDSISFFYPLLNDGGIILCDDYGASTCPGATRAIDDFLKNKPEKMISYSRIGGFFIKGIVTKETYNIR